MRFPLLLSVALLTLVGACRQAPAPVAPAPEAYTIPNEVDGVRREPGNWTPDLPAGQKGTSLGNHRAVVEVDSAAAAVRVHIPWRRHDPHPAEKAVRVVAAATGAEVPNTVVVRIDNEAGDLVFQPAAGDGTYYVYYLPYETTGGYYPRLTYLPPQTTADPAWVAQLGPLTGAAVALLPPAHVESLQSINAFHSFFPMEVIATREEVHRYLERAGRAFHLFPEDRAYPIRMRHYLPHHWVAEDRSDAFEGSARRGEYYTFQIGVYAPEAPLEDLRVMFGDFEGPGGAHLEAAAFTCFNTGGIDEQGRAFTKHVAVPQGDVQALWMGVQIPDEATPGPYTGTVTVTPAGVPAQTVRVRLHVIDALAPNHGDDHPEDMTRLRWLNSTLGTDPDFIIAPFEPVRVEGHTLHILGRDVVLGSTGLPSNLRSYFTPEMTGFAGTPAEVLARPVGMEVRHGGGVVAWVAQPFTVRQEARGRAHWSVQNTSETFELNVDGALEYDGMLDYKLTLIAREAVDVADIALPVALQPEAATYMLGLGYKGTRRPPSVDWKWDVKKHQEGVWLGAVNRGLQYVLRDENYERPLNTNFYQNKPLNLPPSWFNDGRGGIRIETTPAAVVAHNYSGPRHLNPGDTLHFNIRFLLTPFKPIDTGTHFDTRFVHKYVPVDTVRAWGGTVVNIHHANEINPYINYPFYNLEAQTAYIREAHEKGIKVKLYDTIRELTYRTHELFALRSLGDEIFNDGDGGGHAWLQEHLEDHYHAGWHAYNVDDAAILDKGTSRWTNYYVEGLNWLAENQHIDGLYLDDIAFSRETVKRMVSVLHRHRDEVVIDLHSANQFNPRDGFINSAFLYMEHFPFISRLWFGEYFEYDRDEDYWLTEVSGLPFGLMGEMLQDGGHPYRGLLYGMTTRMYGTFDPRPVWRLMSDFGIDESRMLGYWLADAPVRTDHPRILATAYVRPDSVLIALASWAPEDAAVRLTLDRARLGLPEDVAVELYAPAVEGLQAARKLSLAEPITVEKNQGLFILIHKKQPVEPSTRG